MRRRDLAECDFRQVDTRAVRWACQGTPMELNRHEQTLAVKRMAGLAGAEEIARRIGSSSKQVWRILAALGAITCPVCRQLTLHTDGVLGQHLHHATPGWCPMSGEHHEDQAAIAARAGWCSTLSPAAKSSHKRRLAAAS